MENDSNEKGKQIVAERDRAKAKQGTFRTLWQSVSDLMFPHTFGITDNPSPGQELMTELFDTTAMEEAENMTSGLVVNLFPPGQQFFKIEPAIHEPGPTASRYTDYLAEKAHETIANSNYMSQISNTIHYWLTFGTGAFYTEWTEGKLNCRDYAIGTYQCCENHMGVIDTIFLSLPMTARQAVQKFGKENVGQSIAKAFENEETRDEAFNIIHCIKPRYDYDPNPVMRPGRRKPVASIYVSEKDYHVIEEGGFEEFPFAVPRYQVIYGEVYGRGRGVTMLPQIRVLNRMAKDFLDMANKWVNPPRQVLESFEGQVDVTPGATNYVQEINSIQAIDMGANGAYPVGREMLEYYREGIRQGFFKNAFEAITPLQGDRRTTTEIIERLKEGMKRLSKPIGRLFDELLSTTLTRISLMMIRNGAVEPPPPELQGVPFKIKIINPLSLAIADQQSKGLQYWVAAGGQMEQFFPGITDNVNADVAFRDLGRSLGVKSEHIRTELERDEIREERQQDLEEQQAAQMAMAAAEGYGKATKSPEPGSPAEMLTGGA